MSYLIVTAVLLAIAALAGFVIKTELQTRKHDREETLRLRAMTAAQRQDELVKAKRYRADTLEYRDQMFRLYRSFRWGHRHNPHRFRYTTAQASYSGACARVAKIEGI
ncbi:MAG: hypothetical protein IT343_24890, partial [Candidatus Melainabacteria bacterium]|nr:hypothetical protein [Candidatus Melainabacteria bacterium]